MIEILPLLQRTKENHKYIRVIYGNSQFTCLSRANDVFCCVCFKLKWSIGTFGTASIIMNCESCFLGECRTENGLNVVVYTGKQYTRTLVSEAKEPNEMIPRSQFDGRFCDDWIVIRSWISLWIIHPKT